MKRLYCFLFGGSVQRQQVIDFFDGDDNFGAWFYSMPNSVFVYSQLSALEISNRFEKHIGNPSRHFVLPVHTGEYFGRMPNEHWDIVNNNGALKRYDLIFSGYYLRADQLSERSGVYCVYRCTYSRERDTVSIQELLYIGQAENIRKRHVGHEKISEWSEHLSGNEVLCYSQAFVNRDELDRCEAALIYSHKPICNKIGIDSFDFADTYLTTTGRNARLLKASLVESTK